eukprot:m.339295 g.339295  ORF g.339295 m.339295 type:complete len:260 (+) comp16094_c1_seq6:238-1017(+)
MLTLLQQRNAAVAFALVCCLMMGVMLMYVADNASEPEEKHPACLRQHEDRANDDDDNGFGDKAKDDYMPTTSGPDQLPWEKKLKNEQLNWFGLPSKVPVQDNDAQERGKTAQHLYETFYDITRLRCDTEVADVVDKTSMCTPRIHELISIVTTQLTKNPVNNKGGWGLMYFLQVHKLIVHDLLQMPVTACGIGEASKDSEHLNWVDRLSARSGPEPMSYQRADSFQRWHARRYKLQPTVHVSLWCPLEKQSEARLGCLQ